jgi:hypothetical protein
MRDGTTTSGASFWQWADAPDAKEIVSEGSVLTEIRTLGRQIVVSEDTIGDCGD